MKIKDERIEKELNQIKLIVLGLIGFFTVLLFIHKALKAEMIEFSDFYIETWIISMMLIIGIIRSILEIRGLDERLQLVFSNVINWIFFITLFGVFVIHFMTISHGLYIGALTYYPTSLLLLVGFILLVVLTRIKGVYLHYRHFQKSKTQYRLYLLKNVLIFSLLFSGNILFFISDVLLMIVGAIVIIISLISLLTVYLVFASYEYNHHQEKEEEIEGKTRNISQNVFTFMLVPFIFGTIYFMYQMYVFSIEITSENGELISTISRLFMIYRFDMLIYNLFVFLLILKALKVWQFNQKTRHLYVLHYIFSTVLSLGSLIFNLFVIPSLSGYSPEEVMHISRTYIRVASGISLIGLLLLVYIVYRLKEKNIPYIKLIHITVVISAALNVYQIIGSNSVDLMLITILGYLLSIIWLAFYKLNTMITHQKQMELE